MVANSLRIIYWIVNVFPIDPQCYHKSYAFVNVTWFLGSLFSYLSLHQITNVFITLLYNNSWCQIGQPFSLAFFFFLMIISVIMLICSSICTWNPVCLTLWKTLLGFWSAWELKSWRKVISSRDTINISVDRLYISVYLSLVLYL